MIALVSTIADRPHTDVYRFGQERIHNHILIID